MKKVLSFLFVLLISTSLCVPAFAADTKAESSYEKVITDIEASNAEAECLWQQAVQESQLPENQLSALNMTRAVGDYKVIVASNNVLIIPDGVASIKYSLTYITGTDAYGHELFGEVRNVSAYGANSSTQISVNDIQHVIIDSGRTIAANFSLRVGIKQSDNSFIYHDIVSYVEFYSNGSWQVF